MRELAFLALIIIILVIVYANSPLNAAIIIALIVNCLVVYYELSRDKFTPQPESGQVEVKAPQPIETIPASTDITPDDGDLANAYGPQHAMYDSYINTYDTAYDVTELPITISSASERDLSMDNMSVEISRRRARDKRVMDGMALKDSDFYKHHYAQELDESEKKQWWGNNEW
jgi:hypothetical protein